jgi:hypothetical protein
MQQGFLAESPEKPNHQESAGAAEVLHSKADGRNVEMLVDNGGDITVLHSELVPKES